MREKLRELMENVNYLHVLLCANMNDVNCSLGTDNAVSCIDMASGTSRVVSEVRVPGRRA